MMNRGVWFSACAITFIMIVGLWVNSYKNDDYQLFSQQTSFKASNVGVTPNINITLYEGEISSSGKYGFGFSSSNLTSPGPTLTLTMGDVVEVTVYNVGKLPHSWQITQAVNYSSPALFGAQIASPSSPLAPGAHGSVVFTLNQSGYFFYICAVPGHTDVGMWGSVVVTINEYLAIQPNVGGPGYNQFFPDTLVVDQGNPVNITVRNLDNRTYRLAIENIVNASIPQGNTLSNGSVTPTSSAVPVFNASTPGIFTFSADNRSDMTGHLVVLPTNWTTYNPQPSNRSMNMLVLPDLVGDGYDRFLPQFLLVNQNDNVTISVRNMDTMSHGLALPAYDLNVALNPGQSFSNGTFVPFTTLIPAFNASTPGVFQFECTVYCGPGHIQMIGALIVLPTRGLRYDPIQTTEYEFIALIEDFAGTGYPKFIPEVIFVNQGDILYTVVRNTCNVTYGLSIPDFSINNVTIAPATNSGPAETYLTPISASKPGIYAYTCTFPRGIGESQMTGYIAVLPKISGPSGPSPTVVQQTSGIDVSLVLAVGILLLVNGLIGGLVVAVKIEKKP